MPAGALARRRALRAAPPPGCARARRNMRARPGVWPLLCFEVRQLSVLGLADTAARRACRPQRLWRGARAGRPRGSPAEQASSAACVAAAALQTQARRVVPGWVPGCELQEAVAVGVALGTQLCIQLEKT